MSTGVVKFFNATKNFGFITPNDGGNDVFVHGSNVLSGSLNEGDNVEYSIGEGKKGPEAKDVNVI